MTLIKTLGILSVFTLVTACALPNDHRTTHATDASPLIGSWQLLSEEVRIDGKRYDTFDPATRKMTKIFNATHFMFVSNGANRPHFSSYSLTPEEKIIAFDNFSGGGGRYTVEDGHMTEHIEYMNYPNYEGESIRFKITINGDTLIQEGYYPIAKLGLGNSDGYLYSVFKRID